MGRWVSVAEAVGKLEPTSAVVLPPGAGGANAVEREIARQAGRLRGLDVYSGLLLSDYPFLCDGIRYTTWHVMPPVRDAVRGGRVGFLPIRGSQVTHLFRSGRLPLDVVVVHVSPPDNAGRCSLGTSVSYPLPLARLAPTVIAQVNPRMPRVAGDASLHVSEIDWLVEVDEPLPEHPEPAISPTAAAIGDRLAALIPSGTTLQVGIGAIPEALLQNLCNSELSDLRIYGMGVDAIVALATAGKLRATGDGPPAALCAELMGTATLFDFAQDSPVLEMHPFDTILDPAYIATFEGFVSVNSAVQVDLAGQANVEHLGDAFTLVEPTGAARVRSGQAFTIFGFESPDERHPGTDLPLHRELSRALGLPHAIVVNRAGERFGDESFYGFLLRAVKVRDDATGRFPNYPCYLVGDNRYRTRYRLGDADEWPANLAQAPRLGELAGVLGTDPDGLVTQIAAFNKPAERGDDPEFDRGTLPYSRLRAGDPNQSPNPNLGSLREPPFWGLPLKLLGTGIYSTGQLINGNAQVLSEDRRPIDGLYATGNAAAYVEQPGYVGGLANARAITYAYLAAGHAASCAPSS